MLYLHSRAGCSSLAFEISRHVTSRCHEWGRCVRRLLNELDKTLPVSSVGGPQVLALAELVNLCEGLEALQSVPGFSGPLCQNCVKTPAVGSIRALVERKADAPRLFGLLEVARRSGRAIRAGVSAPKAGALPGCATRLLDYTGSICAPIFCKAFHWQPFCPGGI